MAAMNSSVLACSYVLSAGSDLSSKLASAPTTAIATPKLPAIRAQQSRTVLQAKAAEGRRAALLSLAAIVFTTTAATSSANASIFDEYLEKSKANKVSILCWTSSCMCLLWFNEKFNWWSSFLNFLQELNDKKRLATTGANFARAYTVEFGTCKFPENFTGCQDLAKKKVWNFWVSKTQLSWITHCLINSKNVSVSLIPESAIHLRWLGSRVRRQRQVQVWIQCLLEMVIKMPHHVIIP